MKSKLMTWVAGFLVLITGMHVQLNVGWVELGDKLTRMWTGERSKLLVGFLPVT